MATQLNDINVIINNKTIFYVADSLTWVLGLGEYASRNAVVGGGQTEKIFSKDLASKIGKVKLSIPSTEEGLADMRAWKTNDDENVVELVGPSGTNFTAIFTKAGIMNDPEISAATDGNIEIEFESNPAQ